jgi:hypothetical protein
MVLNGPDSNPTSIYSFSMHSAHPTNLALVKVKANVLTANIVMMWLALVFGHGRYRVRIWLTRLKIITEVYSGLSQSLLTNIEVIP